MYSTIGTMGCNENRPQIARPALMREKADGQFLYCYFASREAVQRILSYVSSSGVPHINLSVLRNFEVPIPPVKTQQAIASILSTYDGFVANNRRRIQLLEQAARLLYREWFVRLRYPGHEHVKIKDGVPEDWKRETLANLCQSVKYGYTASSTNQPDGPKYLRIIDIVPAIIDWDTVPHCEIPDHKKEEVLLHTGDIVIARTGATVGYAKRIHKRYPETVFASYLVRLRPRQDVDDYMLGVFAESDEYKAYINAHVGGAAQPNANAKVIAGAKKLTIFINQFFRAAY